MNVSIIKVKTLFHSVLQRCNMCILLPYPNQAIDGFNACAAVASGIL